MGRVVKLAVLAVLATGWAASAFAQRPGERVVVVTDYETRIGNRKIDRLYAGSLHTIAYVEGKWCSVDGVEGWLPVQYVLGLDRAVDVYTKRIDGNDKDADAFAVRGLVWHELGDHENAFLDLNQAIALAAGKPSYWNNRAIVLCAMGRYEPALADLNEALRLSPQYIEAFANRGLVYYAMGQYEKSVADFDVAIERAPRRAEYLVNRGSAHHALGRLDEALADFRAALALEPQNGDAYLGQANVLLGQGKLAEADAAASRAVQVPRAAARALNARGWIRYKMQRIDEALADLDQAVKLDPQLAAAYSNRGVVRVERGEIPEALRDYEAALALDPDSAVTLANQGAALFRSQRTVEALASHERAIELAPTLTDALNGLAWLLATAADAEHRDGPRSEALARQACELTNWKNGMMVDTLAAAMAEQGKFEEAEKFQLQGIELAGEQATPGMTERLDLYRQRQPFRFTPGE